MSKEDFAYCGLSCTECKSRFGEIRQKMKDLDEVFEKANVKAMAKAIPFMKANYQGYRRLVSFFKRES